MIHNYDGTYRIRIKKDLDLSKHSGLSTIHAMREAGLLKTKKVAESSERSELSLKRSRKKITEILMNNLDLKSYFLTLTYANDVTDYNVALKQFNKFVIYANRVISKPLKYICMKELQKSSRDGVIHYHLVVFDIEIEDILKLKSCWFNEGYVYLKKINDLNAKRIANYITSYITDPEKGQLIKSNYRLFSTSSNLKKTIKIKNNLLLEYYVHKNSYNYDSNKFNPNLDIVDLACWCFGDKKVIVSIDN